MLTGEEILRAQAVLGAAGLGDEQVQPNGIDLTLDSAWRFAGEGRLGVSNQDRQLAEREPLSFDVDGWLHLPPGTYGIRFGERVEMPTDCGGLAFPRSSLLRMGAHIPTAVWDAGYAGNGEGLLVVANAAGLRIQRSARIAQLVLFRLSAPVAPYSGQY